MDTKDSAPSRRNIFKAAGLAVGAAVAADALGLGAADGQPGIGMRESHFWTAEYWAKKGSVDLYLYRKRTKAPAKGERPLPVLFLVHGSSISARPSYDLTVPGAGEYSVMNVFAHLGYDVWTTDQEGYGHSSQTAGNSDIASGVEDLKAGTDLVMKETGQSKMHFFGESSGALRVGAFAMAEPARCDRLGMSALTYTGKGSPTLTKRAEQVEYYRTHNRRPRGRDMIESIFTRDKAGTSDPRVAEALADAELKFGDTIPTGTYLDMTANLPVIDPTKIQSPVVILRGQYDGIASEEDVLDFFQKLPNPDRQVSILPGVAHSVAFSINRQQFWHVLHAFLTMPPRLDA